MAVTAAVAKVTDHALSMLLTQDGGAGTTLAIPNATMRGFYTALGFTGPLSRLLDTDGLINQAGARARALGDASGLASQDLRAVDHCVARIMARTLVAAGWLVDADQDGVTATRFELNVTAPAGASTALLTIEFQHSQVR